MKLLQVEVDTVLTIEYRLRLLDGVLARKAKEQAEGANVEAAMTEAVSNVTPVDRLARRPTHRQIVERIVITGTLVLETPAHFGNGDADAFTDMPLLGG